MSVGLVWAQAANGVIGRHGTLPWHLPEDLKHFRNLTSGTTVVMGRGTWDSLPEKVRPLPGRRNIVLTKNTHRAAPGANVAHSLAEALSRADGDVWVIGGASVYAAALEFADHVVVTELQESFDGDVYAPELDDHWRQAELTPEWQLSSSGLHYRVVNYVS